MTQSCRQVDQTLSWARPLRQRVRKSRKAAALAIISTWAGFSTAQTTPEAEPAPTQGTQSSQEEQSSQDATPSASSVTDPREPAQKPAGSRPPQQKECFPRCRQGYVCHQGNCVSACNPPCPQGQQCTAQGTCVTTSDQPSEVTPSSSEQTEPARSREGSPPGANNGSAESATPPAESATAPVDQEEPVPKGVNLHINALGLLQFGLIPQLELGGSTTFLLGTHFYNTGALSYVVVVGDEYLDFSIGGNLGVRHYFDPEGGQQGFYLGGFFEYAYLDMHDDFQDYARYERHMAIPAVDIGYRWVWGSFLLDLGAITGVAIPVVARDTPIGVSGCRFSDSCLEESETTFFGMAVVNVGFFF